MQWIADFGEEELQIKINGIWFYQWVESKKWLCTVYPNRQRSLEMWKVKKATSTMFLNLETYKKLKRFEFTSKQYFPLVTPEGHECTADNCDWEKKVLFNIKIQPIDHVTIKREIRINCQN